MIDHIEVLVSNPEHSTAFYQQTLAPLGYELHVSGPVLGFGSAPDRLDFWLRGGTPAIPAPHFAFGCATRAEVIEAHRAGLGAGGTDTGAPAVLTRIHPHYFAGFVRDPDGHNVEFVCHSPIG